MSLFSGRTLAVIGLSASMVVGLAAEASASGNRATEHYRQGHGYGQRYVYRRHGNPAVGAAVAGAALGVIGLAAGAAASNRYDDGYDGGYYAPGRAPGYGYYGSPYGYDPY